MGSWCFKVTTKKHEGLLHAPKLFRKVLIGKIQQTSFCMYIHEKTRARDTNSKGHLLAVLWLVNRNLRSFREPPITLINVKNMYMFIFRLRGRFLRNNRRVLIFSSKKCAKLRLFFQSCKKYVIKHSFFSILYRITVVYEDLNSVLGCWRLINHRTKKAIIVCRLPLKTLFDELCIIYSFLHPKILR